MQIKKGSHERAFTLFEFGVLLVGLVSIVCTITIAAALLVGNFWFTEASVLEKIQRRNPQATEIVDSSRHVWKHSVVTVREGGVEKTYYLNTNMLWNYRFSEKEE